MNKKILGILLVGIVGVGAILFVNHVINSPKLIKHSNPNGNVTVNTSTNGSTVNSDDSEYSDEQYYEIHELLFKNR